jgi:hypothetical protein
VKASSSGSACAVSAGSACNNPDGEHGSDAGSQNGYPAIFCGSRRMSGGNPNLWRFFGDDNRFASDVDIQAKDKRSASGGIEKGQTACGSKDKYVSWLSSRAPGLDWPGYSLPGKRKIGTEMGGGSIYRIFL